MTTAATAIEGLGQISVIVTDLARAVPFYRDTLGLPLLFEFPGMAFFDCGGVRLYMTRAESPQHAGTSILYFRVRDIEAMHARLAGLGVAFQQPPHRVHADARHELWLAFFTDTEGNQLALMHEKPAAQAAATTG